VDPLVYTSRKLQILFGADAILIALSVTDAARVDWLAKRMVSARSNPAEPIPDAACDSGIFSLVVGR
jgi:hypothetical protein